MIKQIRTTVHTTASSIGRTCLSAVIALCLALVNSALALGAPQVLVIATSELPPFVSAEPRESFLTELLAEVADEMDVVFEFHFMPWPRCEIAVDTLQAWATMPYVPTPERNKKFLFSKPLYTKRTVLFHYSEGDPRVPMTFTHLNELSPHKIGGVRGYYYLERFAQAGLSLELTSSEELSFRKLQAGRVELVPAVESVGWNIIRRTFPPEDHANFYVLETSLNVGYNHLMTSRNYPQAPQLLDRFNTALEGLRGNGVYDAIALRHGITGSN